MGNDDFQRKAEIVYNVYELRKTPNRLFLISFPSFSVNLLKQEFWTKKGRGINPRPHPLPMAFATGSRFRKQTTLGSRLQRHSRMDHVDGRSQPSR